jgi:hypothetical protein
MHSCPSYTHCVCSYANPGPVQFAGRTVGARSKTLALEPADYLDRLAQLHGHLRDVLDACQVGCDAAVVDAALASTAGLTKVIAVIRSRF